MSRFSNKNLQKLIVDILSDLEIEVITEEVLFEVPANREHGHLSCNVSMLIYKKLSEDQKQHFRSPRMLADELVKRLKIARDDHQLMFQAKTESFHVFDAITVAGPGFINFFYSKHYLLHQMCNMNKIDSKKKDYGIPREKIIIEFTDPNPFKELHIGHLYSNIVGESLSKLTESLGHEIQRVCYQGDVGMHVSKSIWGMKQLMTTQFSDKSFKDILSTFESKSLKEKVGFLGKSYALGATHYKESDSAKSEIQKINYLTFIAAQENLKNLRGFEPQVDYKKFVTDFSSDSEDYILVKSLYLTGRKWSLDYFEQMYAKIGMKFDDFYFESLVGEYGYRIVQEHIKDDIFRKSKGAIIFPGSEFGLHDRVFINSLGFPTYEAKELGLAPEKYKRYKYDRSIIITGNEIDEYFKVLMMALSKVSPELQEKTTHLSHGMVRLPEGKMSSRTGKVITAEWLINEAELRILRHIRETRIDFDDVKAKLISEKVGLGAIKYAFLKQAIGKDIAFSFEESLSFSGNSGPYLQYTYVRCLGILNKTTNRAENRDINKYFDILINNKYHLGFILNRFEQGLLLSINTYFDIVKKAAVEFAPQHLCTYLYTLAQEFNSFYAHHKVIDAALEPELQQFRIVLTQVVGEILKDGLHILGIGVLEEM